MAPKDYLVVPKAEWSTLGADMPLTLTEEDIAALRGANEAISLEEVEEVYIPLSRLLNLHVEAARNLAGVRDSFLSRPAVRRRPYVIGVAGSVAVGKSTFCRVLQALLARWPSRPRVDLVTTDGFLHPNDKLVADGIMNRKGFPESYDRRDMIRFLSAVKAGHAEVRAPIYSHLSYDVVPNESQIVDRPDVLIFEGLNVLQTATVDGHKPSSIVSDFFDFSIYLDADVHDIECWYVERFLLLQRTVFKTRGAYFRDLAELGPDQAPAAARKLWKEINCINLLENILPTRERADVVMRKSFNHLISEVWLR